MRVYDGATMDHLYAKDCPDAILAIEFISDKNQLCVSLSNRSFHFFDTSKNPFKEGTKLKLRSTQKCLCYVKRKRLLFSGGTDGCVFAWNIDKICAN